MCPWTSSYRRTTSARLMTAGLCSVWIFSAGSCWLLRLAYGPKYFNQTERIGWLIIGAGTALFAASAVITIIALSPSFLRKPAPAA